MSEKLDETKAGGVFILNGVKVNAWGKPLVETAAMSMDEAMTRFKAGDTSPEVFDSMKFHQAVFAKNQKSELPNKTALGKMNKEDLLKQAETEGLVVTDEMDTNAKVADAIFAARK